LRGSLGAAVRVRAPNFLSHREPEGPNEQKNFGCSISKIGGDIKGVPKIFSPPYLKNKTYDFKYFLQFERAHQCASMDKFIEKSIRRKFVKNANERGHKFLAKNSKVRPPANSKTRTNSAIVYKGCFMEIRFIFSTDKK